ncbi:glycosyltransferase family 1 protein [Vibrio sp. SCSIO 43140]|uniref:glycosyltransferase n=1 Tax=Vibrio sp. SCSIO 43140 TaxID=2819100 RepID=UPI0020760DFA|nr:glycosyltransferase [Vibrio sp. SCSIO 43140]USD63401.1 glycosyltransferase family 1 protein [Vibrio sp. SCSIO 43140]
MKILLMTIGSRGDVEPYIALGKALKQRGHYIDLCAAQRFKDLVEAHGLSHKPLSDDLFQLVEGGTFEKMGSLVSGVKAALRLMKLAKPINRQLIVDSIQAGLESEPELVIYHPKCLAAVSIAEKFGVPAVVLALQPMIVKTRSFPPAGIPNFGSIINRLSYHLINLGYRQYLSDLNAQREALLDLPPLEKDKGILSHSDGRSVSVLHAFSEHLVPRPLDWPNHSAITGYCQLTADNETYQPPQSLTDFLAVDKPTVYIGFGSMSGKDPERTTQIIIEAVQKAGVRAIIATGWGGLKAGSLPSNILNVDSVAHSWLFPQVTAVVHHGGAGTTAAGLMAGKPTLICPFFADQPFWGAVVARKALGPTPIKQSALTADKLACALRQLVEDERFKENAQRLSIALRSENGADNAIEWMKQSGILKG